MKSFRPAVWLSGNVCRCFFIKRVLVIFQAVFWDFSLVENYFTVCIDWEFLFFNILSLYSALCCLRRRALHSADQRSGEAHQLCQ